MVMPHCLKLALAVTVTCAPLVLAPGCGSGGGTSGVGGEALGQSSAAVTVCPAASTLEGVDVSQWQGTIDWSSVASSGRRFAIARVSDGTGNPDPTFQTNWSGIKAAGMVRGVYQFFRASDDPVAQANLLVTSAGTLAADDLSPVADVEVMDGESGATLVTNLAAWVARIKAATGRTPIIYSAPGFWNALPNTAQFASNVLWVANWQVNCPDTPTPWTAWSMWQYADNGTVPGISGAVDLDRFNGTLADLQGSAAAAAPDWAAKFVSQSFPLASTALPMVAGQTIHGYFELKNVGAKAWDTKTRIGTTEPRDRSSAFADSSWLSPSRPVAVTGTVAPGATFKFELDLHAPGTPGTYMEHFGVVEDGVAWFGDPGQGGPPDDDLAVQVTVSAPTMPDADAGGAPGADAGAAPTEQDAAADAAGDEAGDDAGLVAPPAVATGSGNDAAPGTASDGPSGAPVPTVSATRASGSTGGCSVGGSGSESGSAAPLLLFGLALALRTKRRRA